MENKFDVFISYSRKDLDEVKIILKIIKHSIPDLKYWFDITGIESGEAFEEKIVRAIDNSSYMLFFYSENSKNSKWTKKEIAYAENTGKKVIPILLKGQKLDKGWFLFRFGQLDCIDSTDDTQMNKLITNLSEWINKNKTQTKFDPFYTISLWYSKIKLFIRRLRPLIGGCLMLIGVFTIVVLIFTCGNESEYEDVVYGDTLNITIDSVSYDLKLVKAGDFIMGDDNGATDESPARTITLSKDYYIGTTEVTQELWDAVMGYNPSLIVQGRDYPVTNISWDDCQDFIKKLNEMTGREYRLPTEAEWEYAARERAKNINYTYSGSNQINDVAWYDKNSQSKPQIVKSLRDNNLGLYDMSGNVWEWCADVYNMSFYKGFQGKDPLCTQSPTTPDQRVIRGGSWYNDAEKCRVGNRGSEYHNNKASFIGFRLAHSLPTQVE